MIEFELLNIPTGLLISLDLNKSELTWEIE